MLCAHVRAHFDLDLDLDLDLDGLVPQRSTLATCRKCRRAHLRGFLDAVRYPTMLDVGAAAYGPPEQDDGSDALLAAKVIDVPMDVHAFEMQPVFVLGLEQSFALLRSKGQLGARETSFTVHQVGVGSEVAQLQAAPIKGSGNKKRTIALANGDPKQPQTFTANVASLVDHRAI